MIRIRYRFCLITILKQKWILLYFYNFLTIFTVFSKQITFILDIAFFIFLSYNVIQQETKASELNGFSVLMPFLFFGMCTPGK
jgi:hypothetical protein